jgi:drug/metabolite transporter (DMT)-like permease
MRAPVIIGIILIILGGIVLVRGGSFTTKQNVLEVGDLTISADERQTIPPWAGILSIVAGAVVIGAGSRKRG